MLHRPPPRARNAGLRERVFNAEIRRLVGNESRRRKLAGLRFFLAVLVPHRGNRSRALKMFPGREFALRIDGALHLVIRRGAIEIVLHIVFPGPQHHHRFAGSFGYLRGFHDKVGLIATAEAAAHQGCVHVHFLRRKPGNFGNHLLRPLRRLRGHPRFRAVRLDVHGAIHRLHAGMRGKGQLVHCFDLFAPEPSALSASPSLRTTLPGCAAFSMKCLRSDSLDSPAFGPSSQVMSSALRPCTAAHELSASTTTPPAVNAPSPTGSMGNTSRTPATCLALAASNFASLPPKTGQRAITAYCIPAGRASMPNFAAPVDLAAASKRLRSWPTIVKSSGFFSGTVLRSGTGSLAASSTSSP